MKLIPRTVTDTEYVWTLSREEIDAIEAALLLGARTGDLNAEQAAIVEDAMVKIVEARG